MKHIFTRFLFIALAFLAPLAGWGQTTVTYTFSVLGTNDVTLPSGSIDANVSYSTSKNTSQNAPVYNSGNNTLRLYYASNSPYAGGSITITPNASIRITQIELEALSSYTPTVRYTLGNATFTTSDPTATLSGTTYTYNNASGLTQSITFRNANTSNTQLRATSVKVTYSSTAPACTPPTTAATIFTSFAISTTGATLGWANGNGTNRVVFLKASAFTAATPATNTTYAANSDFSGNGALFDGSGKTVYNNSGNSVSVTNLTPNTVYNAKVFEYSGAAGAECYNTTALSGNFTTISNAATTTAATVVSGNSFKANWTAPTGSAAVKYTLEVATDNAFTNIISTTNNITSTNQTVGSLSASTTYYYRVKVVNDGGTSVASNITTVTTASDAPPAPTVTQNCGSTTLAAYTGPDANTYYWQGTNQTGTDQTKPATADYVATSSGTYYVRALSGGQWSAATAVAVTVIQAPAIGTQPSTSNLSTCIGTAFSTATLSVTASNAASYQWYSNTTASTTGGTPVGTNSSSYTVPTTTAGTFYYYVVVSNAPCASVTSSVSGARTVNAVPATPNGTISGTTPACSSTSLTYTPGAGQPEAGVTYYWQTSSTGTSTANDAASPQSVTSTGSRYVRAAVGSCWSAGSTAGYSVTISTPPSITAQPNTSDLTTCSGTNFSSTTVAVTASNAASYQWYSNSTASNTGGTAISGATARTYTVPNNNPGTLYYYVEVSGNAPCPAVVSDISGARTVNPTPADPNGTISGTTPACSTTTLTYTAGAGQPEAGAIYYWQTAASGKLTTNDAATPLNLTTSGTYYVRAVIGSCWSSGATAGYAVVVNNNPSITTQPANTSVGAGSNATFTVSATNAGSYQWQEDNGSGFYNLPNTGKYSGVNTATLTITGPTLGMDQYLYRVLVKAAAPCTGDVYSAYPYARLNVTPVSDPKGYFRSRATGLYGSASTWESSVDSLTWYNATVAPTNTAHSVTIRATDSVTVATSGRTAAHLYVFGKLTLSGQDLAIADSSGYDVVIFGGGQFDCGTNINGNAFSLAANASVLVKTGGRIIARINKSLDNPGRGGADYFYEDAAVLEYTGSGSFSSANAVYSLPTLTASAVPVLLFSKTVGTVGASSGNTIFDCFVEIATGVTIPWSGTSQKIFNAGLLVNGEMKFNNNVPFVISGTNTTLEGSGLITLGTGTGTNTGGMSIAAGATVRLLSDIVINSDYNLDFTVAGTFNTNGHILSGNAKFATAAGSTLVITDAAGISTSGTSGNIQPTGTRTFNAAGNYVYRGTAAQVTGNGLPTGSATLEIDNAAGVTLGATHTTNTELRLISGNLTTSANELLTLGSAAMVTGGSATSYVKGPMKRATAATTGFLFPIGNGSNYAPVTITPQAATPSDYTAEYFSGNQSTPNRQNKDAALKFVAANEHFEISRGAGAAAQITLSYTSAAQVTDATSLVVAHYTGGQWVSEGGTASGTNTGGTVTSVNFANSFSPFALGSTSSSQPLPVQIISFELHPQATAARLKWQLATPEGGETVVLERSANGGPFQSIHQETLARPENAFRQFVDSSPAAGVHYYRLRVTEPSGRVQYSKTLTAVFEKEAADARVEVYPNPAKDVIQVRWNSTGNTPQHISLYNSAGQQVWQKALPPASRSLEISVEKLPAGLYWLQVAGEGAATRVQVVVQH